MVCNWRITKSMLAFSTLSVFCVGRMSQDNASDASVVALDLPCVWQHLYRRAIQVGVVLRRIQAATIVVQKRNCPLIKHAPTTLRCNCFRQRLIAQVREHLKHMEGEARVWQRQELVAHRPLHAEQPKCKHAVLSRVVAARHEFPGAAVRQQSQHRRQEL